MIRLILYIVFSLIIAAAAAWAISLPGVATVDVAGYRLQPGLGVVLVALAVIILVAIAVWALVRRILEVPRTLARLNEKKAQQMGVDALSSSVIALQAGDPARARSLAREAQMRLPNNAAARLLEARADLALGELGPAREHYRALISNPETALAALSGLFEQAQAQGRPEAALTFARKASNLAPGLGWANDAVFEDMTRRQAWDDALEVVAARPVAAKAERTAKKRQQAVLHTAIAAEAEANTPAKALEHAMAALKLVPDFVPAALISARIHINRGEVRKAQSLLRRVWRDTGHPHVATLFANAQSGASAVERLKRMRDLIPGTPDTAEAALVLAQAAADAYEWSLARNTLAGFASTGPSQGVCVLMAEIEEGQSGDQGKAREWLARAVRAPRDPSWTADGLSLDEWEPVSPVTGKLDALVWGVPTRNLTVVKPGEKAEVSEPDVQAGPVAALPPG